MVIAGSWPLTSLTSNVRPLLPPPPSSRPRLAPRLPWQDHPRPPILPIWVVIIAIVVVVVIIVVVIVVSPVVGG